MADAIPPEMGGAKLARARGHLEELHAKLATFAEAYGQTVTAQLDEEAREMIIDLPLVEPPIEIALTLGDCVQALRSALDHTVHEPARRRKGNDLSRIQ